MNGRTVDGLQDGSDVCLVVLQVFHLRLLAGMVTRLAGCPLEE
jgi:hypothetical protein